MEERQKIYIRRRLADNRFYCAITKIRGSRSFTQKIYLCNNISSGDYIGNESEYSRDKIIFDTIKEALDHCKRSRLNLDPVIDFGFGR